MAPRGKRLLVGCGIGCGALLVLVIVLVVGFFVWINRPGELLQPQTLLGDDTAAYVEWTLRLEDPGTEGFVRAAIQAMQDVQAESGEELPAWMQTWLMEKQKRETEKDILELFPMVAAWTVQPGATLDEDLHLLTLSIEKLGNQLVFGDWILGFILGRIPEARVQRHGREKIYQLPLDEGEWITFFLHGSDFFLTTDLETARLAVDRLAGVRPAETRSTNLRQLLATTGEGKLRGALTNSRGELSRFGDRLDGGSETWDELLGVTLDGGLQADGSLSLTLGFQGPDAEWSERQGATLEQSLRTLASRLDVPFELSTEFREGQVRAELLFPDLAGSLQHVMLHGITTETEDGDRIRIGF